MNRGLSQTEVLQFHDQGYLGPFTLCSPDEMQLAKEQIDHLVYGDTRNPFTGVHLQSRHLDNRTVYELCSHPAIVDRVSSILGPNLILWQSNFFNKEPATKAYPWHQDRNFWAAVIEPPITVSAWLAIDKADGENSCVQVIPQSHKRVYTHVDTEEYDRGFSQQANPEELDYEESSIVSMPLQAGQFFLFNERTLHRSSANSSDQRRLGLAVRLTIPITRVYKKHPVLLVKGEDPMGFNDLGVPPAAN